jgi:ribose-phosphate pyrophosphokinase
MKIVLGPASEQLGQELARLIDAEAIPVASRLFPDGESYIRLEGELHGEDVAIVQTTSPPQDTRFIQLALMAGAARRNGAKSVTAVVPYLAYARQDKIFLQGEAISIEIIAGMLKTAGVSNLITVNVHQEKILTNMPFPARSVSAIPLLADHFKQRGCEKAFALAPDEGAVYIAQQAKKILGGECGYLEKHRDRYTGQVTMEKKTLELKGNTVIIFDDIISTGGTIVAAARILKDLGARRVYAACVHPILINNAEERILEAGVEDVIGTDSVPSHASKVSLAPLLSKELV